MKLKRDLRRDGFTLTEMAITAGIVVIVGAIAVANHRRSTPRYRLERATARLATDLGAARMRAISECLPVTVTFNVAAGHYTISCDSNTNGTIEAYEKSAELLDSDVNMVMGGSCTQGCFSARGSFNATVPFWLIKLGANNADGKRLIYVLPNGQVRCTTNELSTKVAMAYCI
jgi:prepilin-type N-terminal cleavage/methylation domain-containing protein